MTQQLKRYLRNSLRTNRYTFIFFAALAMVAFLFWKLIPRSREPSHYITQDEFLYRAKKYLKNPQFRGKYCWQNDCFIVQDVWQTIKETSNGYPNFDGPLRIIKPQGFAGVVLVETPLKVPTEYTKENLDSSKWHIEKMGKPRVGYLSIIVSSIFTSGALGLTKTVTGDVLFIGLGGGGISNFVSTAFQNINVTMVDINPATKPMALEQFEVVENAKSRIIIEDGAKFIKDQVAKKNVGIFDAIIVDACYNNGEKPNVCPVDPFIEKEGLVAFKKLLRRSGVVIYNVLVMSAGSNKQKLERQILEANARVFGSKNCRLISIRFLSNKVLICSPIRLPREQEQNEIQAKFNEMFDWEENGEKPVDTDA